MHIKKLHPDSAKDSRYLYERSDFTSASPLLDIAKEYCDKHPEGAEVNLADIYGALASRDSESNYLEAALHNFQLQWEYLQKAFEKGLLERGKSLAALAREGLSLGGLGNGYAGVGQYSKAEGYYRQCLAVWKHLPERSNNIRDSSWSLSYCPREVY